MTRVACVVAVLAGAAAVSVTTPGWAGEAPPEAPKPDPTAEAAEALHVQATDAYKRGEKPEAIELWREALALKTHWKYAYNLANALFETYQPLRALEYIEQADRLGIPVKYKPNLGLLRARTREQLQKDGYAWLVLTVEPADAQVMRNGEVWPLRDGDTTRELWTKDTQTTLVVTREGYEPFEEAWTHLQKGGPVAKSQHAKTVRLIKAAEKGRLVVRGEPAGARVAIDGQIMGALPEVAVDVVVGDYQVAVELEGFKAQGKSVRVRANQDNVLEFALVPVDQRGPPPDLALPGWISLGVGTAAVAAGVGLILASNGTADDLDALNAGIDTRQFDSFEDYQRAYDEKESTYDLQRGLGIASVVVGSAAIATGAVLVLLDESGDYETEQRTEVGVVPLPGGAAVHTGVRF